MNHADTSVSVLGNLMVQTMGFSQFTHDITGEIFWQNSIPKTSFAIQVRSGFNDDGSELQGSNSGVRLVLINVMSEAQVYPTIRVRRTKHLLRNIREKVGVLWKVVVRHRDPSGTLLRFPKG